VIRGAATLAIGLTLIAAAGAPQTPAPPSTLPVVTIANGETAIAEALVTVALPRGLVGESFVLRDADGDAIATQVLRDRTLAFVAASMAPREVRRLRLEPTLDRRNPVWPLVAREHDERVELTREGRPVASYRTQLSPSIVDPVVPGQGRGAYLHPLRSPSGRAVTGDGAPERPEQRGLWSAWGLSSFQGRRPDFWNTAAGTGTVEYEGVLETWSGAILAGFRSRHRFVDRTVRPPLTAEIEGWQVTLPALGATGRPYHAVDLEWRHEATTAQPLVVATAAYGGLGVRGPRAWQGSTAMAVLTSEGRARATASRSRARWIAIVGLVDGANAGLAILDHPGNPRHPQPVYVDRAEPFVSYAAMQLGPLTIAPDRDVTVRYRVVTFDGWPERAWLEGLWQAYAHPPRVTIARER
jgi:hypothetical protein